MRLTFSAQFNGTEKVMPDAWQNEVITFGVALDQQVLADLYFDCIRRQIIEFREAIRQMRDDAVEAPLGGHRT